MYSTTSQGAGGKVVETAIELGVTKVISGDFGPKAKDLLEKFNIQMVILLTNQDYYHHGLRNEEQPISLPGGWGNMQSGFSTKRG